MVTPLTFALDFDGTLTACPELWSKIIALMEAAGHRVVLVTCRHEDDTDWVRGYLRDLGLVLPMVFTANGSKIEAVKERGIKIDVWCDDQPETIIHGWC